MVPTKQIKKLSAEKIARVHQLWDELADYPASASASASDSHTAVYFLLDSLGELLNSACHLWLAAVQFDKRKQDDPASGWVPVRMLIQDNGSRAMLSKPKDFDKYMSPGKISEATINHIRQAGEFRSTLLRDHVSPSYMESNEFINEYTTLGRHDTLSVIMPMAKDVEVYILFYRSVEHDLFTEEDLELASYALRGLKWFHRQALLSYGLVIAEEPLTPTQRKVLNLLLTKKSEKEIADTLRQKKATTHEHVTQIYRKFNVSSRAALMAIWLTHFG